MRARQRKDSQRISPKPFLILCEGEKTEPSYVKILKKWYPNNKLECPIVKDKHNNPHQLINKMNKIAESYADNTVLVIICDKDSRSDQEIQKLIDWKKEDHDKRIAIINDPCFEYWLSLHFQDNHPKISVQGFTALIKEFLPHYNKEIMPNDIKDTHIKDALKRAKSRNNQLQREENKYPHTNMPEFIEALKSDN